MTKITFIGAGSVEFTKNVLADILSFPELAGVTISLHDIDPDRLRTAESMARRTSEAVGARATIEAHLDRRAALDGADYAVNEIAVGGHAATRRDFEIPKKYGLRQTIADTRAEPHVPERGRAHGPGGAEGKARARLSRGDAGPEHLLDAHSRPDPRDVRRADRGPRAPHAGGDPGLKERSSSMKRGLGVRRFASVPEVEPRAFA